MPVDVKFHTKALQYERGQEVLGLTRGAILDGLIARGLVEVLRETPDRPLEPADAPDADAEPVDVASQDESAVDDAPLPDSPRRGRKRADDADQ